MVPGSLYSTHLDGAMRRWLGVFTMGLAHDLCPGRRSETLGSKDPPLGAGSRSHVRSSSLGTIGCPLIATCRKFAVLLANSGVDASNLRFLLGFLLDVQLSLPKQGGDTFAGELPGEIADEEIHGKGGGEVIDLGEKIGGEDLGLHDGNS